MERGMSKMLLEVVSEICSKYELDISEVKKEIGLDVKIVNEKEKNKEKGNKIMLPFCGRIEDERCQGIKINYCLYTQCENNIFQKNLCKTCHKQSEKIVMESQTMEQSTNVLIKTIKTKKEKNPLNIVNLWTK